MKIINRQFELEKPDNITVEYIENALSSRNEVPIRWAIVKIQDNKLTVDAVLIGSK
jgi:hypothetical protein